MRVSKPTKILLPHHDGMIHFPIVFFLCVSAFSQIAPTSCCQIPPSTTSK